MILQKSAKETKHRLLAPILLLCICSVACRETTVGTCKHISRLVQNFVVHFPDWAPCFNIAVYHTGHSLASLAARGEGEGWYDLNLKFNSFISLLSQIPVGAWPQPFRRTALSVPSARRRDKSNKSPDPRLPLKMMRRAEHPSLWPTSRSWAMGSVHPHQIVSNPWAVRFVAAHGPNFSPSPSHLEASGQPGILDGYLAPTKDRPERAGCPSHIL